MVDYFDIMVEEQYEADGKKKPPIRASEPSQDEQNTGEDEIKWTIGEVHPDFGVVAMVGSISGESYRWFTGLDGTVSMIPLSAIH